jgi:hypothetical protein
VTVGVRGLANGRRAILRPTFVSARVRGPATEVAAVSADALEVYADLTGLTPGRYNLPVRYQVSGRIAITSVAPASLDVTIR